MSDYSIRHEKTILVVDDARNIRTMVAAYLEQEGFRVTTAANGREAMDIAGHARPDLIILDLMMPEMGGYEFLASTVVTTTRPSSSSRLEWRRATRCWG